MSAGIAHLAESATIDACWRQWSVLTGDGIPLGRQHARSIIDPEALVLASLSLRERERRLTDRLLWWADTGAKLLSVQRLNTMKMLYPRDVWERGVPWFAARALERGDGRWKKLASTQALEPRDAARPGKGSEQPHLIEPAALMLCLRAGFGVGVKADLMTFLIGSCAAHRQRRISATAIAGALAYSKTSVRRAATEMAQARFIEASADRPTTYAVNAESWARTLRLQDPYRTFAVAESEDIQVPVWRFWSWTYAFLEQVRERVWDHADPVVRASRARDIAEEFRVPLAWMGLALPDARQYPGERYFDAFVDLVQRVTATVEADVSQPPL